MGKNGILKNYNPPKFYGFDFPGIFFSVAKPVIEKNGETENHRIELSLDENGKVRENTSLNCTYATGGSTANVYWTHDGHVLNLKL